MRALQLVTITGFFQAVPSRVREVLSRHGGQPRRSTVLRNSFWFGFEMVLDVVLGAVLSILVARVIGPTRLGQFVYFAFLTSIANRFVGVGAGAAARKYMAEHLARGEMAEARGVFFTTLRIQVLLALAVLAVGWILVFAFVDPPLRPVAGILVAAIVPALLNIIPSLANMAAQDFSRNVPGAMAGLAAYAITTILTLRFGWGLVGLALAMLFRRLIEFGVRFVPAALWMRRLPQTHIPHLYRKLLTFSGSALAITAVAIVVNDRSEIVFLKHFCDVKQVAYYSIAFSLLDYLMVLPQVFGGAIASAFMADFAHDPQLAASQTGRSLRYLYALILPLHVGLAAIATPLLLSLYGAAYRPAANAILFSALLGLPRAIYWLPNAIFQAANRQAIMLRWLVLASVVNISLDATLIPRFGSTGAAIANGVSQAFAVACMMHSAKTVCPMRLPWNALVRITTAAAAMGIVTAGLAMLLPAKLALITAICVGAVLYPLFLRVSRALDASDLQPLVEHTARLPKPLAQTTAKAISLLAAPRPVFVRAAAGQ